MIQQIVHLDRREKEVVRLWQSGDISLGSARTYLDWVRRFCAYCRLRGLDETAELTLEGAMRFALSYVGRRKKGPVGPSSGLIARNALHAWAFALGALGISVPEWNPKKSQAALSPLLKEYFEFRRRHRGVAERTLRHDAQAVGAFLSLLRSRGKSVARLAVADIDAFVAQQAEHVSAGEPSPELAVL